MAVLVTYWIQGMLEQSEPLKVGKVLTSQMVGLFQDKAVVLECIGVGSMAHVTPQRANSSHWY